MKKNNLLIKLLTLLIIIAAVLPVFYMPAYAVEEEYGTQDISDHGISEQGENITSSESETSYVEEGNNVFDIVPKGYTLKAVQTRSVEFIIQYPPGQPTGNVTYELKKEINNREIVVKRGTLNKSQKKITFKDLELNTPYKFYLTKVPNGYGKPDGSVAEFYFDNDGIHFTKGESGIALTMTTAYVHFIVQNTSGLPVGGVVRYALNKVKGNQETQIKAGTADRAKLKMYNSSMLGDHNSPLQPLIAFEIINKTDIKVQKVNKSGESLEGAAFRLEKLGDASFTPVEMGNESAISDFTFKCLDAGEYRLTEIKAPSNYIPLEEPILFTIIEESNGVFKIKLNTENSKVTLEEGTLTIKVANEKTVTTEITVDKKWFRADGTEFHPQDGEISYNLIQVLTTEGGESSEKIYKSGETLTSQDGWQKTYSNLPAADINGNGEKEICTYYVKEILIADYSTSYSNGSVGESEDPSTAALSSGTITVKNTEKMKFILPETGGTGRGILYIAGVFLLGISMILLGNKNSSFYECLHKKG